MNTSQTFDLRTRPCAVACGREPCPAWPKPMRMASTGSLSPEFLQAGQQCMRRAIRRQCTLRLHFAKQARAKSSRCKVRAPCSSTLTKCDRLYGFVRKDKSARCCTSCALAMRCNICVDSRMMAVHTRHHVCPQASLEVCFTSAITLPAAVGFIFSCMHAAVLHLLRVVALHKAVYGCTGAGCSRKSDRSDPSYQISCVR